MAFERSWLETPTQLFTVNGGANGLVTIASTSGFKVKQIVKVSSTTQPTRELQVKRVLSPITLVLGPKDQNINMIFNLSAYLVADMATIHAALQSRPGITLEDRKRAVYEEEPTVAERVIGVDEWGKFYTTANPFPVAMPGNSTTELTVVNKPILLANTEYSVAVPQNTKKFEFKNRKDAKVQYCFIAGETNTNFMTLSPGSSKQIDGLGLIVGKTIYFRATKDDQVMEILFWT